MGRALKTVVIEDDPSQRRLMRIALEYAGHTVIFEAARGDAPGLASLPPCDVAIVDLNLPGKNGVDVIHALRDRQPELPIIVITASAHSSAITEALLAGALGYVVKGTRFADVVEAVELVADKKPVLGAQAKAVLAEKLQQKSPDIEKILERLRPLL